MCYRWDSRSDYPAREHSVESATGRSLKSLFKCTKYCPRELREPEATHTNLMSSLFIRRHMAHFP